jgi:hypothetical protein
MNPGPIEEAGKVAIGTIDALKSQPMTLALVILQLTLLGVVVYASVHRNNQHTAQLHEVYQLLTACMGKAGP